MNPDDVVRSQLLQLLQGGHAHFSFDQAVSDFPLAHINTRPPNVPYTLWHLLEHLRIAQWDILEFIRNPSHVSPEWPVGYWPNPAQTATTDQWQVTLAAFRADQQALVAIVTNPQTNLYADLPHAAGYNILREILVVADHNAYHIGEFAIFRQILDIW